MNLELNVEKIYQPISEAKPSGDYLYYEAVYDQIREARREDDASLPQGIWQTDLKKADWQNVMALCLDVLENRSKDLQVMAWLTEALTRIHGFEGLFSGLQIMYDCCEIFWDDMHPQIENDGLEDSDKDARFAPLIWLNDKLPLQIKRIPLTAPSIGEEGFYSWLQYEEALQLDAMASKDPTRLQTAQQDGKITLAQFTESAMMTQYTYYKDLYALMITLSEKSEQLAKFIVEHDGKESPTMIAVRATIQSIIHFVRTTLRDRANEEKPADTTSDTPFPDDEFGTADGADDGSGVPTGRIRTRAEAYRLLARTAEYLLRTEPHSPAPYLVKRAVVWGSMSLPQLLQELLRKGTNVDDIYELLGMSEKKIE